MQNITGKIAFGGIAIGKIKEISKENNVVRRVKIEDAKAEIARFEVARDQAAEELKGLYDKAVKEVGEANAAEWARKRMGHLLQDCGIDFERVRKYERGPCLHCFRHTFVAKAFDQLLQTPLDFADAVPFISTYLGHCDLRATSDSSRGSRYNHTPTAGCSLPPVCIWGQ